MRLGLSISDAPDLAVRGLSQLHLVDAMVSLSSHLLAHGDELAYGGDLRKQGFTEILHDVVRNYAPAGHTPGEEVVHTFLAWPEHLKLSIDQQADLVRIARVRRLPPPDDLGLDDSQDPDALDEARRRYSCARSLTFMRQTMTSSIDARVSLGGQLESKGKFQGMAEEAWLALEAQLPLFLVGGYGGCTAAIIEALQGRAPSALTLDARRGWAKYDELHGSYAALPSSDRQPRPDFDLVRYFNEKGVEALNNGLEAYENERLFETVHIPEIVALVIKGLNSIAARRRPGL